jgi:hypothetical protein
MVIPAAFNWPFRNLAESIKPVNQITTHNSIEAGFSNMIFYLFSQKYGDSRSLSMSGGGL